ncbi:TIGR02301 family protein [Polycladidibacter hongkongensis]|uniref:TIGR02301 family protein n=1 Tax=Polycladidibacter hongkongensis TaxID=1647556 RepID=UPI0008363F9B|nr:TIGR02301 family protein [Pseudovibrio hongkongensis]
MALLSPALDPIFPARTQVVISRLVALLTAAFLASGLGATGTWAQETGNNKATEATPPAAALLDAPYESQLMKIAEVMGALHFLRPLCGAPDEREEWRNRMLALLNVEVQNELRRRRFVERFNRSYRSFASVYESCTPSAQLASQRFAEKGWNTTQRLINKYRTEGER